MEALEAGLDPAIDLIQETWGPEGLGEVVVWQMR